MRLPSLFNHGIQTEKSHIRAHVGVLSKTLFVFPTASALACIKKGWYETRPAYQPGVSGPTALGYLVPPADIEDLQCLQIPEDRLNGFEQNLTTSQKGDWAVAIVQDALRWGVFPLWTSSQFVTDVEMQVSGTDVEVKGKWKIEVKCDYTASFEYGIPDPRCHGNLFLQTSERNPLKRV